MMKGKEVPISRLSLAEEILAELTAQWEEEFRQAGVTWNRDFMDAHSKKRAAVLNARNAILDEMERYVRVTR